MKRIVFRIVCITVLPWAIFACASMAGVQNPETEETEGVAAERQQPEPDDPAPETEAPEEASPAADSPEDPADRETAPETEPDWLVDEEGLRYRVEVFPKVTGRVERVDEDTIQTPWGFTLEIVGEDAENFYYKAYAAGNEGGPRANVKPTQEEYEQVAATYVPLDLEEVDRLRFEPFDQGLPETGQWRNGFEVVDINGDGHLDIVHGPPRKDFRGPRIFLGDGEGTWRQWTEARLPGYPFTYGDVAVADFNRDDLPDLAVTSHMRGTVVMVADPESPGTFVPWSEGIEFRPPAGGQGRVFSSRTLVAFDWNQDGWPDLLALGEGPRLELGPSGRKAEASSGTRGAVVYLNGKDGTWERFDQGTGEDQVYGDDLVVGDFDGDERPDFATGSNVLGRRDVLHLGRDSHSWEQSRLDLLRPRGYLRAMAVDDFDEDGRDDLAVSYMSFELGVWRTGIDLFFHEKTGDWTRRTLAVEEGNEGLYALTSGDLDGDENADLVGITGEGHSWIFLGDGRRGFVREASPEVASLGERCRGYHVEIEDLTGDGRGDLLVGFAGEPSALFDPERCVNEGSLRVWRSAPAEKKDEKSSKSP